MDEPKLRKQMQAVVDMVRQDAGTIRTGRATPSLVEDVVVEAYEGQSRLRVQELATIQATDAQTLTISPWDKTVISEIKKAIENAKSGLSPVITGETIRINMPPMTSEDREGHIKLLHQKLENGRVQVRQTRQEGMQQIRSDFEEKNIGEDEKILQEKKLQEMTDKFVDQIDQLGKEKEADLSSV